MKKKKKNPLLSQALDRGAGEKKKEFAGPDFLRFRGRRKEKGGNDYLVHLV